MKNFLKLHRNTFISRAFTSLLGTYVNHRWYVNFTNVLYNGHVVKISNKAKLPKLTLIDNTITVIEMLVDHLTGDLVFVADGNDIHQC